LFFPLPDTPLSHLRKESDMKKSLIFVQNDEASENAQNVQVHIEADRASALELLALGTRSVMETLSISLYEYL
jgi:hypothetical protein